MKLNTLYIYIVTTILSLSACSTNSVVEEIPDTPVKPSTESDEPLRFTGATEDMTASTKAITRSAMLNSEFFVSTYKGFGTKEQQTVMDKYTVAYSENRDDWNGVVVSNWNYIGTYNGQKQDEKYWDLAGYPYRFHAVAPKQSVATPTSISGLKLTDNELFIPTAFQAQTFEAPESTTSTATKVTPDDNVAEPYLVSQVSRNKNGEDRDIIAGKDINTSSTTMTRRVAMPFHHLNSKVRFAVYSDNLMQTDLENYIKDMVITVEKLATKADKFEAYGTDSWSNANGFSNFTNIEISNNVEIFKYNCVTSGRTYSGNDLSQHQSKSHAYWLECPDGIMQLPQEDLKIHVSMNIMPKDGSEATTTFFDYEIKKEEGSDVDPTHWIAGCIHTYYIHLTFDDMKLPILTVTCTLSDWTDVDGSLSTDLEQ